MRSNGPGFVRIRWENRRFRPLKFPNNAEFGLPLKLNLLLDLRSELEPEFGFGIELESALEVDCALELHGLIS